MCVIFSGVVITQLAPLGAAKKAGIEVDDVLTEIGGHKIANDGTVCRFELLKS